MSKKVYEVCEYDENRGRLSAECVPAESGVDALDKYQAMRTPFSKTASLEATYVGGGDSSTSYYCGIHGWQPIESYPCC